MQKILTFFNRKINKTSKAKRYIIADNGFVFVIIIRHLAYTSKSDIKSRRRAKVFRLSGSLTLSIDISQRGNVLDGEEANNIYIYKPRVSLVFFSPFLSLIKFRSATTIHSYASHMFTAKGRRLPRSNRDWGRALQCHEISEYLHYVPWNLRWHANIRLTVPKKIFGIFFFNCIFVNLLSFHYKSLLNFYYTLW